MKSFKFENIDRWLSSTVSNGTNNNYRHWLLKEEISNRPLVIGDLKQVVNDAHDHVRRYLRQLSSPEVSLDPFDQQLYRDPAEGYPEILPFLTLQGYFGEIFAAIVLENYNLFDKSTWFVPVVPFRSHMLALQYLERIKQDTNPSDTIVGRTGDDCVAFELKNGEIMSVLFCEAKCTLTHDSHLVNGVHEDISEHHTVPVDLRQIIAILEEDNSKGNLSPWISALWKMYLDRQHKTYKRYDAVIYVYSQKPKRNPCWLPRKFPHKAYRANRQFEAIELYLEDVENLIFDVYNKSKVGVQ